MKDLMKSLKFSKERKYATIPKRGHTTTNLTGKTKGMVAPGINIDIRPRKGASKKSSYRRR
jgi:hypothetical protein